MKSNDLKQQKMISLLNSLVPKEEMIPSIIKNVNLFRLNHSHPRKPLAYEARIIILAQGQKKVYLGDKTYVYDPFHYLVLSVPLPLECEATASPGKPILGLSIDVDSSLVGEILLEMDDPHLEVDDLPKGIYCASLTEDLTDAIIRLLETLSSERDKKILGPMIVREILYRILRTEKGGAGALQALAYRNRRFFQIAKALNKIHESFDSDLDLRTLAMNAGMSISAFHSSFKAVTNTSPLQYIKSVRLHKARILMTREGLNAYNTALRIGYESPSQFNREYKRYFGVSPGKDAMSMQI